MINIFDSIIDDTSLEYAAEHRFILDFSDKSDFEIDLYMWQIPINMNMTYEIKNLHTNPPSNLNILYAHAKIDAIQIDYLQGPIEHDSAYFVKIKFSDAFMVFKVFQIHNRFLFDDLRGERFNDDLDLMLDNFFQTGNSQLKIYK